MCKFINQFCSYNEKTYKQLAADNQKAIDKYNQSMISILLFMGWLLILLPLLATPFSNTKSEAVPLYLMAFVIFFIVIILFQIPIMKKFSLYGFDIIYSVLFLFGIYLSVVHSPNMRATILIGFFCIMPFSFIDRPVRMNLFALFWFIVHTLLAFHLKPDFALDDTINCLCLGIFSCFLGNIVVRVRLESYETFRLLTIEKETDVLTGLPNRRKLFETLEKLELTNEEKPSGIMMIDIDHFKKLNDTYGHAAGDRCLINFGEVLNRYMQNFRLQVFRYGGEEFVALAYGYNEKEIYSVAESLRIAMQNTDMDGQSITVSIGIAYCEQEQAQNYEKIIARADQAAYSAKRAGRNKVLIAEKIDCALF